MREKIASCSGERKENEGENETRRKRFIFRPDGREERICHSVPEPGFLYVNEVLFMRL